MSCLLNIFKSHTSWNYYSHLNFRTEKNLKVYWKTGKGYKNQIYTKKKRLFIMSYQQKWSTSEQVLEKRKSWCFVSLNLNLESLSDAQPNIKLTGASQFQNTKRTHTLKVTFFHVFHWTWNIKSYVKHKKYTVNITLGNK